MLQISALGFQAGWRQLIHVKQLFFGVLKLAQKLKNILDNLCSHAYFILVLKAVSICIDHWSRTAVMRSYRKNQDILKVLREHITQLRKAGVFRLESERKLAELLQTSRPSIGKALRQLEEQQLILREQRTLHILPHRQRFRYAYVAAVHAINETFWYSAYYQLWNELEKITRSRDLQLEIIQFDPDKHSEKSFLMSLEKFDVVFFSLIKPLQIGELLAKVPDRKYSVFMLDENMETEGYPLYCLSNFEVGVFAAQTLLERGYRHTGLIAPLLNTSTLDFRKRIDGFMSVMKKGGGECVLYSSNINSQANELTLMQRCIEDLPSQGFDSVFFLDDKWVLLAEPLIRNQKTPEFGILAFDGTMTARSHRPPIDTVSHATAPLAQTVCEIIEAWETSDFHYDPAVRCRIAPALFSGSTLRPIG